MTDDLSGQTVKGYKIGESIGTGSFGAVYRAVQPSVGREVAIKIILPAYANQPDFVRRFETEARLIARLEHPHIVPLFDYWREPDIAYLVMRLLPSSLRARLDESGPADSITVVEMVDQIASALAMSHRQGVVHRDIKPDNILLDHDGNAYLSDFGLAEVIKGSIDRADEGGITGSPAYMAPEQLKGEPITLQSDVYALGIVIYEMLTGEHPYGLTSISDLIRRHLLDPLPPLHVRRPELPESVDYVLQRATAKDAGQRYDDMLTLATDLRSALLGDRMFLQKADTDAVLENPYKGLRAFEEVDAGHFYGREKLVGELVGSLSGNHNLRRFLAVVGPSGSGKSSLVAAGLIPALRNGALPDSDRWFVINMIPSTGPLKELEAALLGVAVRPVENLLDLLKSDPRGLVVAAERVLGDAEGDLLLFIDQFEEVFTLVPDEAERMQFLTLLLTATTDPASRLRIIVTLRADFYDRPLLYEKFGALMQARTHIVLPLSESELERAVVVPAERVGVQVEPNLTAAIIADVRAEPGALPLMQYALTEVFERRQGRLMTLEGYEEIGRAAGALARRAGRVYERLTPEQQAVTRQMFLRLVTLGEGTEDVRRRAHRAELLAAIDDPAQLEEVLDIFGRHRLLSFDHEPTTREPTVEVAHEALLREWSQLREWLDESREDVRQQRRLAGAANEWLQAEHDPSFLLRGAQLETIELWLADTLISLTDTERDYINTSIAVRERQRAEEQERREREAALEARAQRFQRRLIGVMFVALVMALILSLIAIQQRSEAQGAREEAERNAEIAGQRAAAEATSAAVAQERADELQSLALMADAERAIDDNADYDLALALAVEANRIPNAPVDAQRLLGEMVPTAATDIFVGHDDGVGVVAVSPDSTRILSGADDGMLILWDAATGDMLNSWMGDTRRVRTIVFLPDGNHAISGGDDAKLTLWDLETGQALRAFIGHDDDVFAAALSSDGTQMISGSRDRTLILWDVATGEVIRRLGNDDAGHAQRITCVAFSPDGQYVVSGSADNTLILWDITDGTLVDQLDQHRDTVNDVVFSPDGTRMLSASSDQTLILWDVESRTAINRLEGHTERIASVMFSPDGDYAVSGAGNQFAGASSDNSIILWDLFLGQPVRRYYGHRFFVSDVAFSPNGQFIISASADQTLRKWPATYDIEVARRHAPGTGYQAVVFDTTHNHLWAALGTDDQFEGLIQQDFVLDDTAAPEDMTVAADIIPADRTVRVMALSPDGTRLLTASEDRTIALWDTASGDLLRSMSYQYVITTIAFSPDGANALTGSMARNLILWDLEAGEIIRTFDTHHTNSIEAVAFSPDGSLAVSASRDRTLALWDVATGTVVRTFQGHSDYVTAVDFSADGQRILSGSADRTLILWNVAAGTIVQRFGASGEGHSDWVTTVALSADGTRALSGSRDRTVLLWDVDLGSVIRRDQGHGGTVITVQFSPDGAFGYSACSNGAARMWPASQASLLDWVITHRYMRVLTCQEQEQFRLGECPADE